MAEPKLRRSIERVVRRENCSGCGACAALSPSIRMDLDAKGFLRPVWQEAAAPSGPDLGDLDRAFRAVCPGVGITSTRPGAELSHPILGPYVSAWTAWATDPQVRFAGSSGGVLTALSAWLLESTTAVEVTGAVSSAQSPTRTVALQLRTRDEVLGSAGSRYAPVGTVANFDPSGSGQPLVGKPCEVYAARRITSIAAAPSSPPVLLSFFCAGTPSQLATDRLIDGLGMTPDEVIALRYRGNGWPGEFAVRSTSGASAAVSYETSWGRHLGPNVQPRCKICPDGTGEHADVAVGDYWFATPEGYPSFADTEGNSVAIARTQRGHDLLLAAAAAGVVTLGEVELDDVAAVQPLQVKRINSLFGRLGGRALAGHPIPRYRGFGLTRRALRQPQLTLGAMKGTLSRALRDRVAVRAVRSAPVATPEKVPSQR